MIRTVKFPCQSHAKYIVAKSHGFLTDFSRVRQVSRFLTECKIFPQRNTKIVQYLWKYQYFLLFEVEKNTFMVRCGKYLFISYIFYVFILQKAVPFSQSRGVKFQKFSGPSTPTMVGPP